MEFSRKLGRAAWHAVTVLLLLLIACHALAPISGPFERVTGSAFNSATADVSVLRGRVVETSRRLTGIAPVPAVQAFVRTMQFVPACGPVPCLFGWPDALGPPLRATLSSSLSARAPPST